MGDFSSRGQTRAAPNIHQTEYAAAFDKADVVATRRPEAHDRVPNDQRLDVDAIVGAIGKRGVEARTFDDVEGMVGVVVEEARPNDVVLVMSNGPFRGFIPSLVEGLGLAS